MDIKFNSLFDNEISNENTTYYSVDREDSTLLLTNLILQRDEEKQKGIEQLEKRQFGNNPNYLISGRPCSSSSCTSGKFCESSGWPDSPQWRRNNICEMPYAPNAEKIDPGVWSDIIDMDSKLKKIDIYDSKCNLKIHKEDPCSNNPELCPLRCHKNSIAGDYMLPNNKKFNYSENKSLPLLTDGLNKVKEAQSLHCKKLPEKFNEAAAMRSFIPTKRRNVIPW